MASKVSADRAVDTLKAAAVNSPNIQGALADSGIDAMSLTKAADFRRSFTPIVMYEPAFNDYYSYIVNKLTVQKIRMSSYDGKFGILKKNYSEYGTDGEITYINPAKSRPYSIELGDTLLNRHKSETITQYFRMNRQDQYPVTIPDILTNNAVLGWEQLDSLNTAQVNSLTDGNIADEEELVKRMMVDAANDNVLKKQVIAYDATDPAASSTLLVKWLRYLNTEFPWISSKYNNWLAYATAQGMTDAFPARVWCPSGEVVIFIRNDILVNTQVETLAGAFNMNMTDFVNIVVPVNEFAYTDKDGVEHRNDKCLAIIADQQSFSYGDNLRRSGTFNNAAGLYQNHYLTVMQTYFLDVVRNAVILEATADVPVLVA